MKDLSVTNSEQEGVGVARSSDTFSEALAIAVDGRGCQCVVCVRARAFAATLEAIPEQHHKTLRGLFSALESAEFERDHLRAVVSGDWPDADAIIAYHRRDTRDAS